MQNERFTNRNHYNPCFWTALWNEDYFRSYCSGKSSKGSARDQVVSVLNIRAGKVLFNKVEQIHVHRDLGVAEVTPESTKKFFARWYPNESQAVSDYLDTHPEVLYSDFEDILTGIETMAGYSALLQAVKLSGVESLQHKGFLACFLMIHAMRSYEFMSITIDQFRDEGIDKWEYFWLLKRAWSSQAFLARAVIVPACSEWTLWRTPDHTFPFCDSPVMISQDSVMAVLSPRLLLEINLNKPHPKEWWRVRDGVPKHKLAEFQRLSISNTFNEIIFHNPVVLEHWLSSVHAQARVVALRNPSTARKYMENAAARVTFGINGFGRLPPENEQSRT